MKRSRLFAIVAAAVTAVCATGVSAAPVQYGFTTALNPTGQVGLPALPVTGPVSGTFYYDSSAPATGTNPALGAIVYDGSFTQVAGSVSGYSFSDPSGRTSVSNDNWTLAHYDFLGLNADHAPNDFSGFMVGGYQAFNMRFQWGEAPTTPPGTDFLGSSDLPAVLPDVVGRLYLDFKPGTGSGTPMYVFWDSLTVTPVPEPNTQALLLAGLALLGFAVMAKRSAA